MNIKKLLPVIIFIVILIVLVGIFTFLRPEKPIGMPEVGQGEEEFDPGKRIESMPGVSDVKRFSDAEKNALTRNKTAISSETRTEVGEKLLPYPRISINYSLLKTSSIRNDVAKDNKTYIIATLDIKNYGYKYFDAHPKKFRLVYRDAEFEPIVTVSTGNMLEEVVTNSSMVKGDLVFLLDKKKATSEMPTIRHTDIFTILYNRERGFRRW